MINSWSAGGGVTWTPAARATVSATFRYESGTPMQRSDEDLEELRERPGAELVDFEAGRVKGRAIASILADVAVWKRGRQSATLSAAVMNLFDQPLRVQLRQSVQRHAFRRAAHGIPVASAGVLTDAWA